MKKIFLYIALGTIVTMSSCKKNVDFGTINQNPLSTPYNATQGFRSLLSGLAGNTVWGSGLSNVAQLYCQYASETQYPDASRYVLQNADWDGFYAGPLFEAVNIIKTNTETVGSNANQTNAARIVKAYIFAYLTDMYGNLPYKEALKGNGILAYDSQTEVYAGIMAELKAAGTSLSGSGIPGDILMNGDVTRWKKFANSLRMVLAMRWVKANPTWAQTQFMDAYNDAGGHINSNAENFEETYNGGGSYPNPFYNYYVIVSRDDYAVSNTFMDFLNSTGDARRTAYGTTTVGFPYGLTRDGALGVATGWARIMAANQRTISSKVPIITAAQVGLVKAEAAVRGWITLDAKTLYEKAITDSWAQWNVGAPGTYLTNSNIVFDPAATTDAKLNRIARQYWVSNFPNAWHGYADWRRTDFPVLTPAVGAGKPIPKRFPYGPNERNLNPSNYNTASALYSVNGIINSQDGAVEWDK
jgi:hypothetical protein